MTADLKVGDRVRVEFDGQITDIDVDDNPYYVRAHNGFKIWATPDMVSKIVGPEPQWKVGDAVHYLNIHGEPIATLVFNGVGWTTQDAEWRDAGSVAPAWRDGRIVRLVPEVRS